MRDRVCPPVPALVFPHCSLVRRVSTAGLRRERSATDASNATSLRFPVISAARWTGNGASLCPLLFASPERVVGQRRGEATRSSAPRYASNAASP